MNAALHSLFRKTCSYLTAGLYISLIFLPLLPLVLAPSFSTVHEILLDRLYTDIIWFTVLQASLGSLGSVLLGLTAALGIWLTGSKVLAHLAEIGTVCFVMPVIIAALAIVQLFGNAGIAAPLIKPLLPDVSGIYGLPGMLLLYFFLNVPFAAQVLLQTLQRMPREYPAIAENLGLGIRRWVWYVVLPVLWPTVRNLTLIIFSICFTAFAAVMILGGGPKSSIMEVEIYRFIRVDYYPPGAAVFAGIQLCVMLSLFILLNRSNTPTLSETFVRTRTLFAVKLPPLLYYAAKMTVCLIGGFTLIPLFIGSGALISHEIGTIVFKEYFTEALMRSLIIAFSAGAVSIGISLGLIYSGHAVGSNRKILSGLIMTVSPSIMAAGWFMLLRSQFGFESLRYVPVIIINALLCVPFVSGIIGSAINSAEKKYGRICAALHITGWRRFLYIDVPAIGPAMRKAYAIAFCLSVGEFTVSTFFGSETFTTLPLLIYRLIGSYRNTEAEAAAFWLFVLFLLVFGFPSLCSAVKRLYAASR